MMVRMRIAVALCAVVLLASGCKKAPKPDIPVYPDAQGLQSKGTMKDATMVLFNNKWTTLRTMGEVRVFYEQALLSRPGWKEDGADSRERVVFTNGNMKPVGDLWGPIDATQSAGRVEIVNASDQRTMIDIWQSFPPPK